MTENIVEMLRQDALDICREAIAGSMPDTAVSRALEQIPVAPGRTLLVSIGKAAWQMAFAAYRAWGERIHQGIVVTKYDHSRGAIGNFAIYEAGHPVPDENSVRATNEVCRLVSGLTEADQVLFLVSGGGSALFEAPRLPLTELEDITAQLLSCGADITRINAVRKRLSNVKGGRFAQICAPAHVYAVLLSDIIGDPLDMIASGPAYPDSSTSEQTLAVAKEYGLRLSTEAWKLLAEETPKVLSNVTTMVTGSVSLLCRDAVEAARKRGYTPVLLTNQLQCEAREAGRFLSAIAKTHAGRKGKFAYILGGETVVKLTGTGKGGRNQELVLAAAEGLEGLEYAALISVGSDGTDGPTDAAGGLVDNFTATKLRQQNHQIHQVLAENDAYHALEKADGLVITGPTGTNVNDVAVLLQYSV